jgi:hypothetical protein
MLHLSHLPEYKLSLNVNRTSNLYGVEIKTSLHLHYFVK